VSCKIVSSPRSVSSDNPCIESKVPRALQSVASQLCGVQVRKDSRDIAVLLHVQLWCFVTNAMIANLCSYLVQAVSCVLGLASLLRRH
jgi:hypothetical protein